MNNLKVYPTFMGVNYGLERKDNKDKNKEKENKKEKQKQKKDSFGDCFKVEISKK